MATNKELTASLKESKETIAALEQQLEAAKAVEEKIEDTVDKELETKLKLAETTINEQATEIKELTNQLKVAKDSIKKGKEQVATATKTTVLPEPFKHGNQLVKLNKSAFVVPGKGKLTADKIAANPEGYKDVIQNLLNTKSNLITIVDK